MRKKRRRRRTSRAASTIPLFTLPCTLPLHLSLSLSWRQLEFLSLTLLTACLTASIFLTPSSLHFFSALPYLSLPPLLLASVRFCRSGGASLLLMHLLVTTAGTVRGLGPLSRASLPASLLQLQLFASVSALLAVAVAAGVRDTWQWREQLRRANEWLEMEVGRRTADMQRANEVRGRTR